jgi:hypothetical protein
MTNHFTGSTGNCPASTVSSSVSTQRMILQRREDIIMIIIRTSAETIKEVVRHSKHALKRRPRLSKGEIILISQIKHSLHSFQEPIQYLMEFDSCYYDKEKESLKLWSKYWPYIIVGRNCKPLKTPFDISKVKASSKNYGQGGPIVYVEHGDEALLKDRGYLETL